MPTRRGGGASAARAAPDALSATASTASRPTIVAIALLIVTSAPHSSPAFDKLRERRQLARPNGGPVTRRRGAAILLVAQRLDGIEQRRFARRIEAEKDSDRPREEDRADDGRGR